MKLSVKSATVVYVHTLYALHFKSRSLAEFSLEKFLRMNSVPTS